MFSEREENVKADIFLAYRSLLTITKAAVHVKSLNASVHEMDTSETNKYVDCPTV